MGLFGKIFGAKETPEDRKAREAEASIIKQYSLRKDPRVANKYLVGEDQYIMFNPRDSVSVANARKTLDSVMRDPVLKKLTREDREQAKKIPVKKSILDEFDLDGAKKLFNNNIEIDYSSLDPFRKKK